MIHLTRLNNQRLVLNADLIKFIETAPDTVITLLTGDKIVVREPVEEVLRRVCEFHERFYRRLAPTVVFDTSLPSDTTGSAPGGPDSGGESERSRG